MVANRFIENHLIDYSLCRW